jgi:hypothetical protein
MTKKRVDKKTNSRYAVFLLCLRKNINLIGISLVRYGPNEPACRQAGISPIGICNSIQLC